MRPLGFSLPHLPVVVCVFLTMGAVPVIAQQRGQIIKPATLKVMDPNNDGFVSKTNSGFTGDGFSGYYADEFEFTMFGIPIVGDGEALSDNQAGPACGISDLTVDSAGFGAYAVLRNNTDLAFRFRIGDHNSSVESYSILLDIDGKMGTDDPNSTPSNPGFEVDITLIKNQNKGIYIYNIDGIESCPTALRNYSFDSNFQISIADIISCSDLDYFYDFFIPFADLQTLFGFTLDTEMRMVAVTNMSGTCAMAGRISDIGGVDDNDYVGCLSCAFLALGTSQCPTSINSLCGTCAGFQSGVTPKPTINTPVKANEIVLSGTAVGNAQIFVDLSTSANVLKQSVTTNTSSSCTLNCPWSVTFSSPMQPGDIVAARAKAASGCSSAGVSSDATVEIVVVNVPPQLSGASTALTYTENAAPLPIDANMVIIDPDNTVFEGANIAIATGFVTGQDILTFIPAAGVSGSFNPSTGVIQFIGVASFSAYQSLLRSVSYSNSSENPATNTRTISFQVFDGLDNSNVISRPLNVLSVNDAPVAVDDSGTTAEEVAAILPNIAANDTDVDGTIDVTSIDLDPVTAGQQTTSSLTQGVWTVNGAGQVTFTPATNFNGTALRTYTVRDNAGAASNVATISVVVTPVNDPPVAGNDTGTTNEDVAVTLNNITSNDTDPDGSINLATIDLDPATAGVQNTFTNIQGVWTVAGTGNLTYTPALNFNGNASIIYIVADNLGALSNTATITITVVPVNDPPVAVNDNATTNENTPVSIANLAANDTDVDGTVNAATIDLDPVTAGQQTTVSSAQGQWTVNSSGQLIFTPAAQFNGTAVRTYTIQDNGGAVSNAATITIVVNPVNDLPVANNDFGVTNENVPVTLAVITSNDTDIDGTIDPTTVDLDPSTPGKQSNFTNAYGNWVVNATGDLTFTPTPNFDGNASATYTVNDNLGGTSNVATISIVVNNVVVNVPPVAVNDNGTTNENTPVTLLNVTSNDTDADGTINIATVDFNPTVAGFQTSVTTTQGTWTVNASADVTFTPATGFTGPASQIYTVQDNSGATSNSATISITVNAVNDPPIAVNDNGVTNKDVPVTLLAITGNDTDVDGTVDATSVDLDPSTGGKQSIFNNAAGSWSVNAGGDLTYTPAAGFIGNATATYTVNDNSGATSNIATILIVVNDVVVGNTPPVAVNDSGTTNEETLVIIFNVTSNDTDADGTINAATIDLDPITAGIQPGITTSQGTWTANASSDVSFTPAVDFVGNASQTYTVQDDDGATSNSATISITVNAVNDAPVAVNDNGVTNKDVLVILTAITANDTDVDGTVDATTVDLDPSTGGKQTSLTNAFGTWSVNANGDVTFTPASGFTGNASAAYTVNDNSGAPSNVATILVVVNDVVTNSPPVAVNDSGVTNEDVAVTLLNVTSNDTDSDGTINAATVDLNPLVVGIQTSINTTQGSWSVNASGNVTFTPVADFNGTASQIYTVQDNSGATSNSATIAITVNAVNDLPVANPDSGVTNEGSAVTLAQVTSNDTDIDGTVDPATVDLDPVAVGQQTTLTTADGEWTADGSGNVTFIPVAQFNGSAVASYAVSDNQGGISNTAALTVIVNAVNDSPVATNDSGTTQEDVAVTLTDITANDTDIDGTIVKSTIDLDPSAAGQQLSISVSQGSWVVDALGALTFTPSLNFNGSASIQYTVNDNSGATSNAAVITIMVNAVNDLPTAVADVGTTYEDNTITFPNITANDTDIDGTINAATVDLDPSTPGRQNLLNTPEGSWDIDNSGNLVYSPATNFNGVVSILYNVQDDEGGVSLDATVTVTVIAVNDFPTVEDVSIETHRNQAVFGSLVTDADNDPDGTSLTVDTTPANPPDHGTIIINADGTFTYTPDLDFVGTDLVEISFCDQGIPVPPACAIKGLHITVLPSNAPPVIIVNNVPGGTLSVSTLEDTPIVVCFNVVDPDGDPITISSITNTLGGGTLLPFGNIKYCFEFTPKQDYTGLSTWTLQACDNGTPSLCGNLTITVLILPINDAPVALADTLRTLRHVQVSTNVLAKVFDVEGQTLAATTTPVMNPSNGNATLATNGDLIYKSDIKFRGIDSLRYEVCDNGSPKGCTIGKVVIIVEDLPLKVYEGISPNGDGSNDYLRIDGIDFYTENEVRIFDRYNNLVFQIHGYNNEDKIWQGQANRGIGNNELPEETYFYAIELGDGSAPLTGFVILKRK